MRKLNDVNLAVYRGRMLDPEQVYEWCRRAPYFMRLTGPCGGLERLVDRRTGVVVTVGDAANGIFPAFIERLRAIAITGFDGSVLAER